MKFRSVIIKVLVMLFLAGTGGNLAIAQVTYEQGQQMTPVPDSSGTTVVEQTDRRKSLVENLDLETFEMAVGDIPLSGNNEARTSEVKEIKNWICAVKLCEGKGNTKEPVTCFNSFDNLSLETKEQVDPLFCPLINSPGPQSRKAILSDLPGGENPSAENSMVRDVGYSLALKGGALSCENYVKDYVGGYGPKWNYTWFRALSGCRILAHESTREQEEKDFYTWFGVAWGLNKCSEINNREMRSECYDPGATASIADYAQ